MTDERDAIFVPEYTPTVRELIRALFNLAEDGVVSYDAPVVISRDLDDARNSWAISAIATSEFHNQEGGGIVHLVLGDEVRQVPSCFFPIGGRDDSVDTDSPASDTEGNKED